MCVCLWMLYYIVQYVIVHFNAWDISNKTSGQCHRSIIFNHFTIIFETHVWICQKCNLQITCISCNTCKSALPDIYAWAQGHTVSKGKWIHIRQSRSAYGATDMLHFWHSKNLPGLFKTQMQAPLLLYTTKPRYDCGFYKQSKLIIYSRYMHIWKIYIWHTILEYSQRWI